MNILNFLLASLSGVLVGGLLGIIFGFALASHADVSRGIRPNTSNRLILLLARPTNELSSLGSIVFLVGMLVWTAIFFGLCAVPAIVALHLDNNDSSLLPIAYVCFAGGGWLGRRFGAHLWRGMM